MNEKNNPKIVCKDIFSLSNNTPSKATNETPPILNTGITTETPGPVARALKEKSENMAIVDPPKRAKIISRGLFSIFLLKIMNKNRPVRNAPD